MSKICISKLTNTLIPCLPELVSIYIKESPTGGGLVAPDSDGGISAFIDFKKF